MSFLILQIPQFVFYLQSPQQCRTGASWYISLIRRSSLVSWEYLHGKKVLWSCTHPHSFTHNEWKLRVGSKLFSLGSVIEQFRSMKPVPRLYWFCLIIHIFLCPPPGRRQTSILVALLKWLLGNWHIPIYFKQVTSSKSFKGTIALLQKNWSFNIK